jgi:hypothetical protein
MYKWTVLFFFAGLATTGYSQNYSSADSVLSGGDTLVTSFHFADTTIGDTVYFGMVGGTGGGLLNFFQKHLRVPNAGDTSAIGLARVYFVIDKTGRITQAWYNSLDNVNVGLSVLEVVNQLPVIRPSSIKGEAVITKVILKVAIDSSERPYAGSGKSAPDLIATANSTVH